MTGIKCTRRAKPCSGSPRSASLDTLKVGHYIYLDIIFPASPQCDDVLSGVFFGRPDPKDADPHESSQEGPGDRDVHGLRSAGHG